MHEGHRMRMFEKLRESDDALTDVEILEIVLYNALPRVNTNPLSHRLLDTFGSLAGVFAADADALMQVEGLGRQGATYIRGIGSIFRRIEGKRVPALPGVFEKDSFIKYLPEHFAIYDYEVLELFFIDEDDKICGHALFTNRNRERVDVVPSDITKAIMKNAGKSMVLAHNHPTGSCHPSEADDSLTKQCEVLCSINNIMLLDHFVCAGNEVYSYFDHGKMEEISREYHIHTILNDRKRRG